MITYPEAPKFNESLSQCAHNYFRSGLTKQWESYGGHISADAQLTARVLNLAHHYVEDVASVAKQINVMVEGLKKTTITTVNQDQAYQTLGSTSSCRDRHSTNSDSGTRGKVLSFDHLPRLLWRGETPGAIAERDSPVERKT